MIYEPAGCRRSRGCSTGLNRSMGRSGWSFDRSRWAFDQEGRAPEVSHGTLHLSLRSSDLGLRTLDLSRLPPYVQKCPPDVRRWTVEEKFRAPDMVRCPKLSLRNARRRVRRAIPGVWCSTAVLQWFIPGLSGAIREVWTAILAIHCPISWIQYSTPLIRSPTSSIQCPTPLHQRPTPGHRHRRAAVCVLIRENDGTTVKSYLPGSLPARPLERRCNGLMCRAQSLLRLDEGCEQLRRRGKAF